MIFANRTRLIGTVLVLAAAGTLGGCDTVRGALGNDKSAPDEFAVVTKAPLVMPPDFNLKPPSPGAPPTNQVSPTQSAQQALYSADPATTAASIQGNMSQGEKLLLAYAGAATADSSIRQVIAADNKNMQAVDETFTDNLMFWQNTPAAPAGANVDADAEARRIAAQKAAQPATPAPVTPPAAPAAAPADQTIQKDDGAHNAN